MDAGTAPRFSQVPKQTLQRIFCYEIKFPNTSQNCSARRGTRARRHVGNQFSNTCRSARQNPSILPTSYIQASLCLPTNNDWLILKKQAQNETKRKKEQREANERDRRKDRLLQEGINPYEVKKDHAPQQKHTPWP